MSYLAARVHELHDGPMTALAVRGDRIVTGGADAVVRVLTIDGTRLAASQAHQEAVLAADISRRSVVVSGSAAGAVRLFDPGIGRSYTVGEHDGPVTAVRWSRDNRLIATASADGTIGVWDPDGASVTRTALGGAVTGVDWSIDDIVATTVSGRLVRTDPVGSILSESDSNPARHPTAIAAAPDDTSSAFVDRTGRLNLAGGDDTRSVAGHAAASCAVAWHGDGDRLVSAARDGTAIVWSSEGDAMDVVKLDTGVRWAVFRGVELYLATDQGSLHILSDDGVERPPPRLPPTTRCDHAAPVVSPPIGRVRCVSCNAYDLLRQCVECGAVGCDALRLDHAGAHAMATSHPVSVPVDYSGVGPWCHIDAGPLNADDAS